MKSSSSFNVARQNYSYVLFSESQLAIEVQSSILTRKQKLYPLEYAQIDSSNLTIYSYDTSSIQLWKIPYDLCNLRSVVILSDLKTHFQTYIPSLTSDFCFFSQLDSCSFETYFRFNSSNEKCKLEVYNTIRSNIHLELICRSNENCKFKTSSPYFIRFFHCAGSSLNLSFTNIVSRNNINVHECSVNPIKSISSRCQFDFKSPLGEINDLQCTLAMDQTDKSIVLLVFLLFSVFSILVRVMCWCCEEDYHYDYQRIERLPSEAPLL